ncbi:MAG: outer membrane beta-barrel protein [Limisphaerales bacterium]
MKKILVSVGLAAVGTAGLHAAYAPDIGTMNATKMWSVAGTLRGFYDDNYVTSSKARSSYGFEVSPSFNVDVPLQQTEIGLRYAYGLYYYQDRDQRGQNPIDQTHEADLWLDHAFTERWQTRLEDSFRVGQEPQLLTGSGATAVPYRLEGDNIANNANVSLHTDWTRLFSTELTYQNGYYDYSESGTTEFDLLSGRAPSYAGLLNRDENSIALDGQWHMEPTMMFLVGYKYEQVNYLGDEPIAFSALYPSGFAFSKDRDNRSQIGYVGTQWDILPNLSLAGKVGAQYTEDYNEPSSPSTFAPYVTSSLTYTYLPGDYVQIGFNQARNATDVYAPNAKGQVTLDQESSLVYASINHKITPKLLGTLIGQLQYSTFNGGLYNNDAETLYSLGLNLSYTFTPHLSADAGYNYDDLTSDIGGRGYSRNRVYIGLTAAY